MGTTLEENQTEERRETENKIKIKSTDNSQQGF